MDYGPFVEQLEGLKKRGRKISALDSRPECLYQDILEAYLDLRFVHAASDPIPVSEIVAWLSLSGINHLEEKRLFFDLIRLLDSSFLKRHREIQNANASTSDRRKSRKERSG